jgi:hypothetical protein
LDGSADAEDAGRLRVWFSDLVTQNSNNIAFVPFPEEIDLGGYKWTQMDTVKFD